ncbi:Hypothetical protein P9303_04911 [Prochlorococcus marinus str. MIT 9303]|uniref:Uncharacterized protein n=1 Tax=Prochlorococcus marinus (strain MIT 9303) TaxID=59922 RepID=A2C6Y3_PROM3|nr:Hypothetical protein P9303_04911 [Prochlorococcus marinus str. MIT 9303]
MAFHRVVASPGGDLWEHRQQAFQQCLVAAGWGVGAGAKQGDGALMLAHGSRV